LRRSGVYAASNPEQDMYCAHIHADARHSPYLCVPMMAHGVSLGLLHVQFVCADGYHDVPDDERLRVQRLSDQVTLALANVKLRQSLREQSIRDLLTGLYNRRYLEESLEREVARTWRDKKPLAVIMLDVDHFKRFNDQYGHEGGDAVLQALGRVLRETARSSDIVARYGGEEFTVLLHNASLTGAREWGERLRENVGRMEVKAGGQTLPPITISLGLAMYGENGVAADELLRAADAALYQAKRGGRDRLVVAEPIKEQLASALPGMAVLPPILSAVGAATV
jgi:diguanylate cyclase (GGDEF)-like protein